MMQAATGPPGSLPRKRNLFGMDLGSLQALVAELGEAPFRARQLHAWLYRKRVRELGGMTTLARAFRARLAEEHEVRWPSLAERQISSDGSVKYLFALDDGAMAESVFIPEARRRTICISTQAGCPLKCAFCLTGIAGYRRNLDAGEILGQVATVMEGASEGRMGWNVVVMGMGEPLLNYDATMGALRILMDPGAFAVSPKKLTLSTVGILPALERLAQESVRPNLAISLHAPTSELRRALVPIEAKYPLDEVVAAAQRYPIPRGGPVTWEYVLLGGVNDQPLQARQLARLLAGTRAKINLIPLNPAPEIPFRPPTPEAVDAFGKVLADAHFTVSVRKPRGQDILAACGQLHLKRGPAWARHGSASTT
jgi:23S rRNA (adenine2503-C2)-methyltransferase